MACECYQIGGPWISYDPDCPTHGDEARRRQAEQEEQQAKEEARWTELYKALEDIRTRLTALEAIATKYRMTTTRLK